jgi:methyltransferase (TIGR00027 family)
MKPISKTAFYTCGVRMLDAEASNPVCGDNFARALMNEEGLRILEAFKDETKPNRSIVARHRIIDDLLRTELDTHSNLRVIIIGAGFDTRAYRLKGGAWVELDEPHLISYKNERLPVTKCVNKLERIAIDFASESLWEKVSRFAGNRQAAVVIEGALMYLEEPAIQESLQTLRRTFPQHKLICDLMDRKFFEKYGRTFQEKVTGMGAPFKFTADNPEGLFRKNGYRRTKKISIFENAPEASGYEVYVFE